MRIRLALSIVLSSALSTTAHGEDEGAALLALIQADETMAVDRANAFEKIGDVAGAEAVQTLAGFLGDQEWSHYARFALQKMEGANVTETLCQWLDRAEDDLKLGLIDTIGRRRDPTAVGPLTRLLTHGNAKVVAAAAVALGEIGTTEASTALTKVFSSERDPKRKEALASSLLLVGQQLAKKGNTPAATVVFDSLSDANVPKPFRIGATYNAIVARGAEGVDLLVEQLQSSDRDFFEVGLAAARVLPGEGAATAIADLLKAEDSTDRQALLILALHDRGDRRALPTLLTLLDSEAEVVELAAIEAIGTLGDADSVPVLLSVASAANSDAVLHALVALKGTGVNAALLDSATPPESSLIAIKALGKRRAGEAVPLLLQLAAADSAAISSEAIVALGTAATQEHFLDLIALLQAAHDADRKAAVQQAVATAVFRSTRPDDCAEALGAMIPSASDAQRQFLFEQIRIAGGAKALTLMQKFANGSDEALQDAATQTLGRWLSADAGPVLLEVASGEGKFANRAMGGYIRLFRQFELPESKRVAMAQMALKAAKRTKERNAAIEALTRFPGVGAYQLALGQLEAPGSEETAAQAVLTISRTVLDLDPQIGRAGLTRLVDANVSREITEAAQAQLQ